MYLLLVAMAIGMVEQPDRDWYLSRKLYEVQVRRGFDIGDYEAAKRKLDLLNPEDQRAFLGTERIRAEQSRRINESRMGVWPVNPRRVLEPRIFYWPYPSWHYSPYSPYHMRSYVPYQYPRYRYRDPYRYPYRY